MSKTRLEALTDGIFAIVMTLLVIEIKVPEEIVKGFSEAKLIHSLEELLPLFFAFFLSFAVLTTFWITHNFNITMFAKNINRELTYLNILFLAFVSLLPFSAHLIGVFPYSSTALAFYSSNFLILAITQNIIRAYIVKSDKIENHDLAATMKFDHKDRLYRDVRAGMGVVSGLLALIFSFINPVVTWAMILLPTIFGIIPGLLQFTLKITGIDRLAKED